MSVIERTPRSPDARAERAVLDRLDDGAAKLRELDHDCPTSSGETFAAACRLSRDDRVTITALGDGQFEFDLATNRGETA